jgi:ABC-type uncharacterized transport system auxiliary subunit
MRQNLLFIILTALVVSGCGSQKTVVKKFYMIEPPGFMTEIDSNATVAVDAWCEVKDVEVYPAFATHRIVFRDDSHQIRYFGHNAWAVRPSNLLTPVIIDYLSAHKIFTRVAGRFWEKTPSYRMETTIFNIEVGNTNKNDFEAHLKLRFELIDTQSDTVVVTHIADKQSVLEEKSLNLLASSISEIFNNELELFTELIREKLSGKATNP